MKISGVIQALIFCFVVSTPIHAQRIYQRSLINFIQEFPQAEYLQCTRNYAFNHAPFPLYPEYSHFFPSSGEHPDMFILGVSHGSAYFDATGYVYINDSFIKETQIKAINFFNGQDYIDQADISNVVKIPGRVAIVSHLYPYCYGLWFYDVLTQLALLEIAQIKYDYLCIPYYEEFMRESLDLWGIDRAKVIPLAWEVGIEAPVIIMPTSTTQDKIPVLGCANYYVDFLLKHVRDKLLAGVEKLNIKQVHSEKIFISRKDAGGKRATPNEDEVFELFKPFGFVRYELAKLSVAEKISLFHNAKTIISFVGSGSTNIMFCEPGTHYIEITQQMIESSFFYIADTFGLKYSSINDSMVADLSNGPWAAPRPLSLDKVKEFIAQNLDL